MVFSMSLKAQTGESKEVRNLVNWEIVFRIIGSNKKVLKRTENQKMKIYADSIGMGLQ